MVAGRPRLRRGEDSRWLERYKTLHFSHSQALAKPCSEWEERDPSVS